MSTAYRARYFAHELTRLHPPDGVDRLSMSLFDACVDLNPHQIDAALFALRSPLSKGVLTADEVGLSKTIEAGLALCQFWAERRRRLLVSDLDDLCDRLHDSCARGVASDAATVDNPRCRHRRDTHPKGWARWHLATLATLGDPWRDASR
jgi:hypothetical protein